MPTNNLALHFTMKIASRCNLNCAYCYVYHKEDQTWRDRTSIMPAHIFEAAVDRIRSHCLKSKQRVVRILVHGGEPCLVESQRFADWCELIAKEIGPVAKVQFSIQT